MAALTPNQQHRNARLVTTMAHARAAFASLAEHALSPSPPHYAIWFDHHGGARPELRAAIEEALARGPIDEAIMEELGGRFFQPQPEFTALSAALTRLSGSLREALGVMTEHGADAAAFGAALNQLSAEATHDPRRLHAILTRLTEEARDMTRRSQEMGNKIAHSTQQIEALRAELEDTRREADTDALTGLPNRRSFDGQLRGLMAVGHGNGPFRGV